MYVNKAKKFCVLALSFSLSLIWGFFCANTMPTTATNNHSELIKAFTDSMQQLETTLKEHVDNKWTSREDTSKGFDFPEMKYILDLFEKTQPRGFLDGYDRQANIENVKGIVLSMLLFPEPEQQPRPGPA